MKGHFIILALQSFFLSACLTIKNARVCTVAGQLQDGGICSELLSDKTSSMGFDEYVTWLEPKPEASGVPGGGAICMSASDWGTMKTELEQACRELKGACAYARKKVNNPKKRDAKENGN